MKMPQKLEEDINDALENMAINAEQIAEMAYQRGYVDGARYIVKQTDKGADYDDIKSALKELLPQSQ